MGFFSLIIVGAAAGLVAARVMRLEASLPVTIGVGILGALVGGALLRFALALTGLAAAFLGAVLGAMLLIWLWQAYGSNGR